MRHFGHLADAEREALFAVAPGTVRRGDPASRLALALGATLYTPATHPDLTGSLRRCAGRGVVSTVLCLEDSVADHQVPAAEANLVAALRSHAAGGSGAASADEDGPLVFVRVRCAEQVARVVDALGDDARVLTGFVLPKVTAATAEPMLDAVAQASRGVGHRLLAMPVLESAPVMHAETRAAELGALARTFAERRDDVLAVRLGTTDLAGLYGLRRPRGLTVYDVALLAHLIADVVNVLGRSDGSGFVVTGPVWEHFGGAAAHDALVREVGLDLANGLLGKTVIHPRQAAVVHAAAVVSHEDLADARDVVALGAAGGGVGASRTGTSMNEARPHGAWARAVLARADVFGVARAGVTATDLAAAAASAAARADENARGATTGRDLVGEGASR